MCGEKVENVDHVVSGSKKLAQKEFKRRHDNVPKVVHWKLSEKYGLERSEKWHDNTPESVVENERIKILWDVCIQCDHVIGARRPDIVIINKEDKNCFIVDIAISGDSRLSKNVGEKVEKYQDLKREIMRMWNLKSAQEIPIIVGALGGVTRKLGDWVGKLNITLRTAFLQKD